MPRPIVARINVSAIRKNYLLAKKHAQLANENARAWAVVKADAYGHGLMRVANGLRECVDGFATLELEGAIRLREAGFAQPILLLEGFFDKDDLVACAEYGLTTSVHRLDQLALIGSSRLKNKISVYLKLNTGMNRLGFVAEEMERVFANIACNANIERTTLMMHFAEADGARGVDWQIAKFKEMTDGADFPVCMANSAALLTSAESVCDWVRPGIMLYGASPFVDRSAEELGLIPAMTLESKILSVQMVPAGGRVGYGGTFCAERTTRVAIVACGYADGYPRHAATGTPILVCGKRTTTVGRVSMDMLACDVTDIPEADVGSPVVLWGDGMPADEVAVAAGTISYEMFCALAKRVPIIEC